jgi:hypothetical protein
MPLSSQRLKPRVFPDIAASLKPCPDTNLLKLKGEWTFVELQELPERKLIEIE